MELYILDQKDLHILSISNVSEYNINMDEETNGVSEFTLLNVQSARKGNYIVLNGLYRQFLFVINDDVIAVKGQLAITVTALDISNIFDRKIILKNPEVMTTTGIETFIANNIMTNFVNTNDTVLNLDYIDVYIKTNTLGSVTINDENGIYNFHTFITNCRQYKDIYTDFSIVVVNGSRRLRIDIGYKEESTKLIDTTIEEVTNYNKIYEVDPVTKVECFVRENESVYNLYLKSDRTTTTDKNDPDRIFGRIETISCDKAENAPEQALNVIQSNRYKHLVEFSVAKTSKLINITQLYVGRKIKIKTEDSIYESYISAITLNDENFVKFKSGNLRIDFTDKQRQAKRDGIIGNKVDVTGGIIRGGLEVVGDLKSKNTEQIYVGSIELVDQYIFESSGFQHLIGAYGESLFESIFDGITIPNGYKKAYKVTSYVSTSAGQTVGVAINNQVILSGGTWSNAAFRIIKSSGFFYSWKDFKEMNVNNYSGKGLNLQAYSDQTGEKRLYHITLHGYLVRI